MREVDVPADALVVRFAPWSAEKVLERAGLAFRRRGVHSSSVFAALKTPDESDDDLRARLLVASELHGIKAAGNPKFAVCDLAGHLSEAGFVFMKDGDDDEAEEHYSIRLGDSPTLNDVSRFLELFTKREGRPS